MIVDLVRNDLGRVAQTGSVRVEELFAVERYPTLWQMTSTVSAELRPDAGFYEIFRALFPCGSVTGAPKVRAMQLIAELEDAPRGVYTGAIGFFSPRQTVFNVAIRTLELDGARGVMGAGSGIVIDSDPAEEYRECLLKAEFLTGPAHRTSSPIGGNIPIISQPDEFFLIETMLWDGGYPLLELHLDRLEDSAEYFDFACDRAAVRAALEDHARPFADHSLPTSSSRIHRVLSALAAASAAFDGRRRRQHCRSRAKRFLRPATRTHRPRAHLAARAPIPRTRRSTTRRRTGRSTTGRSSRLFAMALTTCSS